MARTSPYPTIKGIKVDLPSLAALSHHCRPGFCGEAGPCCRRYEIHVEADEISRIVGWMPLAAGFSNHLEADGELGNVFEEDGQGAYMIDINYRDDCVFSYSGRHRELLCSLHAAALSAEVSPLRVKPRCCSLWPLALSQDRVPVLAVQHDAYDYPCNRKKNLHNSVLHHRVAGIIQGLFGVDFLGEVEQALRVNRG